MKFKFQAKPAPSFDFEEIIYSKQDWIARVTINRPAVYNAYTTQTIRELMAAFKDAMWDDHVAFIAFEEPIFGAVLTNPFLAQTFKIVFSTLWESL